MKKFLLTAVICAACAMTSCNADTFTEPITKLVNGSSAETPSKLIIISGNHANAYQPDWQLLEDKITEACKKNSEIQLILDDGKPFVNSVNLEKIDTSLSEKNFSEKAKKNTVEVLAACMTTAAQTEEVDVFSAISLAERCVDPDAENEIVIIDSMLSTKGAINFIETPVFALDIESSVKSFENMLPNLRNTTISVYGLGEVAGEQQALSSDDYDTLTKFYSSLFEKIGCDFRIDRTPYLTRTEPDSSLPNVSECLVREETGKMNTLSDGTVYELPPEALSFRPDTANFTDKEKSKEKLSDFAEKIADTDNITLVGMTASFGDAESSRTLSLQRAEAVKALLHELGVQVNITCIGKGFDPNPLHTPDLNADGSLNETAAQKNRTVLAMTEKTAKDYGLI